MTSENNVRRRALRGSSARRKINAAIAAGLMLSLAAPGVAWADGQGGGGVPGTGGGTEGNFSTYYLMYDSFYADFTPVQGYGQNSIDYFFALSGQPAYSVPNNARDAMQEACTTALQRAEARRSPGTPAGTSRVVGMYWASSANPPVMWGSGMVNPNRFLTHYNEWVSAGRPGVLNSTHISDPAELAAYYGYIHSGFMEGYNDIPAGQLAKAICIALNGEEAPVNWELEVTTDATGTFEMAGGTTAVRDTIHATASNGNSYDLAARVYLHWDGPGASSGSGSSVASVMKEVTIRTGEDTLSPAFVPSDFGWGAWPSGTFWFDVQVSQQGDMTDAVDTPDRDPRETWDVAPLPPSKHLTVGGVALANDDVLASGMSYEARIKASPNGYSSAMTIYDKILTDQVFIGAQDHDVIDAPYILDPDGNRVEDAEITIDRSGGQVIVSGKVTNIPNQFQGLEYTLVVPTYVVPTGEDYEIRDGSEVCYADAVMSDPEDCIVGNDEQTWKVTPAPDKVWVLNPDGGLEASDPGHTNGEGADQSVFLPGDTVSAVVNGKIHANLAQDLTNYQIIDDWTKAADYVDFSDASLAKVYAEIAPGSGQFLDVTEQFDITVDGTKTIATAKQEFLDSTKGLAGDLAMKLIISGTFRDDYDTDGALEVLYNEGAEVWNNETIPTNEPPVFTWTPDPNKQVLGSADESGDKTHDDINGLSVYPGQKLEYSIGIDLRFPSGFAYEVSRFAVQDIYDPKFVPDRSSVEFWDSRNPLGPKPVPRSAYALTWDEATNSFTAEFTEEWIKANLDENGEWLTSGWLTMRFTGTVKDTAELGSTVVNQAFQIINNSKTATEIPEVTIPSVEPDKEDLSTDMIDIDGKVLVLGDHVIYRLTLDAGPARSELAYDVHKLGMIDDFDEEYLEILPEAIRVVEQSTGTDVTDKFNIQVVDGVAYIFAKQVDSVNAYGETILGEPQPADLKAYDEAPIVPHETPIIDQSLLGTKYWIILDAKVIKVTDGYVIKNQAIQNLQNTRLETKIVSNPVKEIDPVKDVVVDEWTKDTSINGQEIALNSDFNYRLRSSVIPANRAYEAKSWTITDTFDRVHDMYTGVWAIYADTDLYDGETRIVTAGDLLADAAGHESDALEGLFEVAWDEETYTITVSATEKYLALVNSRPDLEQAFSVYTKMIRIAPSERVENVFTERYNGFDRESDVVWTYTRAPMPPVPQIPILNVSGDPIRQTNQLAAIGGAAVLVAAGALASAYLRRREGDGQSVESNGSGMTD